MPLLAKETDIFPLDLLDTDPSEVDGHRWWAVYTKARQEKALARDLLAHSVPFYLPMASQRRLYRGETRNSHLPLFTGYLFLHGDDDFRRLCLETNRAVHVLSVPDGNELRQDLQRVRSLILARMPLTVESHFSPGRRVRIRAGSLMGLEGVIDARRGDRLIVAVRFLNQGVSVAIDSLLAEPVD